MEEIKTCHKCGEEKPITDYRPDPRYRGGYKNECRLCRNDYARKRYDEHKDLPGSVSTSSREYGAWKKAAERHQMSVADYQEFLKNACAICGRRSDEISHNKQSKIEMDHTHDRDGCSHSNKTTCSNCQRDPLCHDCNLMIGMAKDSVYLLQQGIIYLERWGKIHGFGDSSVCG